jgi:hypothetical protein
VHFIFQSRTEEAGFYFLQSKDYDGSLKVSHSHREKKICKINRNIEPGIIRIYDFDIHEHQVEDGSAFVEKHLRIIGMQDEDYTYDKISFEERPENLENLAKQVFFYRNLQVAPYVFSYMRAPRGHTSPTLASPTTCSW